jgi:tRNA G10  N-methylase Trm11
LWLGTFLQELVLLGYRNIIGSDIEQKSIDSTNRNLNWLFENFSLDGKNYKINTFKSDVLDLSSRLPKNSVDAVITEPFLGSSKSKYFSLPEIKSEIEKLSKLYTAAFSQFKMILKNNGVVVIILPVFKYKENFYQLEVINKIISLGFDKKEFINPKRKGIDLLKLNTTKRGSIVFFHPGQTVSREIFVFEKTKKD